MQTHVCICDAFLFYTNTLSGGERKKQDMHVHHIPWHYHTYREHYDIYARTMVMAKAAAESGKLCGEKELLGR